jgi:hypothetical protein
MNSSEKKSDAKLSKETKERFKIFSAALKVRPVSRSELPQLLNLSEGQLEVFIYIFSLHYPIFEDCKGKGRRVKTTYGLLGAPYESQFASAKAQGVKQ